MTTALVPKKKIIKAYYYYRAMNGENIVHNMHQQLHNTEHDMLNHLHKANKIGVN